MFALLNRFGSEHISTVALAMDEAVSLTRGTAADRLSRRAEIKRRLAADHKTKRVIADLERSIAGWEAEIEAATTKHAETCQPLQEQLASDDLAAAKRVELRQKINQANDALEAVASTNNQRCAAARDEVAALRAASTAFDTLSRGLFATGDPALLLDFQVASNTVAWQEQRARAARAELREVNDLIAAANRRLNLRRPTGKWYLGQELTDNSPVETPADLIERRKLAELELLVAEQLLHEAKAERDALKAKIESE